MVLQLWCSVVCSSRESWPICVVVYFCRHCSYSYLTLFCPFRQQFFPSYCSHFFLWHFYHVFAVYFWYILLDHDPKVLCYFHVFFPGLLIFVLLKVVYLPYVEYLLFNKCRGPPRYREGIAEPKKLKQNNGLLSLLLREAFVCFLVTINALKHNAAQIAENK